MAERSKPNRRRVMKDFVITEISACDHPAQRDALAVIMKRANGDKEEHTMQKVIRDEPVSFASFEDACAHLAKVHGLSKLAAMEKVADAHPDLIAKFNAAGEEIAKAATEAAAPKPVAKAVTDFDKRVTEVMARDKVGKLAALE
jgi:hypothetical protein